MHSISHQDEQKCSTGESSAENQGWLPGGGHTPSWSESRLTQEGAYFSRPGVLDQGHFCPLGDIWQWLETLVVITARVGVTPGIKR